MAEVSTERLTCGRCNIEVDMRLLSTAEDQTIYPGFFSDDNEHAIWHLYVCPSCKQPVLRETFHSTIKKDGGGLPFRQRILYPQELSIGRYVPETVRRELDSALKVKKADNNAFAVMVRRTLEQICTDKKANGNTLYEQLEDLSNKNLIPETIATVANNIRLLGNVGAHSSKGNVSQGEAEVLFALLNSVIEYLYTAPALIAELEESLNKASN